MVNELVLLLASLLINIIHSQCNWDEINLGALSGSTIECVFPDQQYEILYSPCRDDVSCGIGAKFMAVQDELDNTCAAYLAQWDPSKTPSRSSHNGEDMYTFAFDNGQASPGCDSGRWLDVEYVCKENAYPYSPSDTECGEEDISCHYFIRIFTNLACPQTTTSAPFGSCVWKSNDSKHILNMTAVAGTSLSEPDSDETNLFYVYTPCSNTLKCDNNTLSMAYLVDINAFHCDKYLAVWEDGINAPQYSPQLESWQFVYTNGEKCDGFENVFVVNWNCDPSKKTPQIIKAEQSGACLYQMIINSSLACD